MKYFLLKREHVALLQRMNIYWEDEAYHGAPAVDIKRPYGNSSIWEDVAEIIGLEQHESDNGERYWPKSTKENCLALHRDIDKALQVCLAAQSFEPGKYIADDYCNNWKRQV